MNKKQLEKANKLYRNLFLAFFLICTALVILFSVQNKEWKEANKNLNICHAELNTTNVTAMKQYLLGVNDGQNYVFGKVNREAQIPLYNPSNEIEWIPIGNICSALEEARG